MFFIEDMLLPDLVEASEFIKYIKECFLVTSIGQLIMNTWLYSSHGQNNHTYPKCKTLHNTKKHLFYINSFHHLSRVSQTEKLFAVWIVIVEKAYNSSITYIAHE